MDDATFSIDFAAAYAILAILLACAFFTATNLISAMYSASYADDLEPLAESLGDTLLRSPGEPDGWYIDPSAARNASIIGLSAGDPNVLSAYKLEGLYFYNASGLKEALGLVDESGLYGLRIEIKSFDGVLYRTAGYPLPPDTKDVCVSSRIATIKEEDGTYRDACVTLYLWRKHVGAM
ncbi:hypothetical protein [Methanocella conradii]|uniref:hypothetical protein n=1 Tax=Methanocella conradii TaxID=1175444 RepID=UPI0024B36F39|nr:hypothetical protein [Methanocella conradii]MDI6897134.1 hypothetical protein [Methanocella conradii]